MKVYDKNDWFEYVAGVVLLGCVAVGCVAALVYTVLLTGGFFL